MVIGKTLRSKRNTHTHTHTNKLLFGCAGGNEGRKKFAQFHWLSRFLSFSFFSFVGRYYVSVLFLMVANCERVHERERERAREGKTAEVIKGVLSVPDCVCVCVCECLCLINGII